MHDDEGMKISAGNYVNRNIYNLNTLGMSESAVYPLRQLRGIIKRIISFSLIFHAFCRSQVFIITMYSVSIVWNGIVNKVFLAIFSQHQIVHWVLYWGSSASPLQFSGMGNWNEKLGKRVCWFHSGLSPRLWLVRRLRRDKGRLWLAEARPPSIFILSPWRRRPRWRNVEFKI